MKRTSTSLLAMLLIMVGLDSHSGELPISNPQGKANANNMELTRFFSNECGAIELASENNHAKIKNLSSQSARFLTKGGVTDFISLNGLGASFIEDSLPNHFAPSCDLAWIGALDKGEVFDDRGNVVANHERYYCVFVSLPRACVVAIHTDMMCAGNFDSDNRWVRDDGSPPVNFHSHNFPTARRYADNANERGDPTLDLGNVLRCDPVSRKNAKDYLKIVNDASIDMSAELRKQITNEVNALDTGKDSHVQGSGMRRR
ncbi:hypothetical protein ACFPU0_25140 [Pseudomonas sp. GCM10022186]|uniref:hypothetical protein n=1 Tax=Pseudomonas sp. GCM10022186 TaxID=3252650 RepID=UPI00362039A4